MEKPFFKLVVPILAMPRIAKRLVALPLVIDLSLCVLTVWLAYYLRLGDFISFAGSSEWAGCRINGYGCNNFVSVRTAASRYWFEGASTHAGLNGGS